LNYSFNGGEGDESLGAAGTKQFGFMSQNE
jgi:hypothetical protein